MTSAYLALQLYLGEFDHIVVPFDQIFDAVKSGRAAAGLIIHEGQLTYARAGSRKVVDLGEWWKRETASAACLSAAMSCARIFAPAVRTRFARRSCARASITDWRIAMRRCGIRCRMRATWMRRSPSKFIGMYVNDYTRDYGDTGRAAIREFLGDAERRGYLDRQASSSNSSNSPASRAYFFGLVVLLRPACWLHHVRLRLSQIPS